MEPGALVEISQYINTLALKTHTNGGEIKAGGRRKTHTGGEQHKGKKEGVKYIYIYFFLYIYISYTLLMSVAAPSSCF